jgi:serine protease AprX
LTRPARVRRALAGGVVGTLIAGSALAAVPGGAVVQAVVSWDGTPRDRAGVPAGVEVVTSLKTLRMTVVRGNADALERLARTPGVRGLAPDDAVRLTGNDDRDDRDEHRHAVLASEGLGGRAGKPGAGAGTRIALVDTGVSDTTALNRASGRLVDAADASRVADGRPVATGGTYTDGYGHGTFMAGIIAGAPVKGTHGKALGVAPGATVLVVRVANKDGSTSLSRVLGGLDWVASHADEVDVANLSLSHTRPTQAYGSDPLTDAVEQVRAAGVTVVVSAGNTKGVVGDPGFDPFVLTVGAADLDRRRVAPFSGSAVVAGVRKPDVVASGVNVLSMLPDRSLLANARGTVHLGHGLYRGSGTSQSTAVVSGLAAIFLAAHPAAVPVQVKASLRCAADDLKGKRDGAGLVRSTTTVCAGVDGRALEGRGDVSGEGSFDASSWGASSWAASSWAASSWAASSWAASGWDDRADRGDDS